ncbi:hypothetical protein DE146DRAFT_217609 [Phaeosphaeria sp. MPI-PUGE-AT-0046c]|nr:hypothetical protein DE146DRAFT_217609 [Phaeosphaeria sp. MPI-PUGE-AT-0046c]
MSNYGSVPPPGPYTPPGASTPGYNAQQQQSYQSGTPNQGHQGHAHKSGGFGQMMNQAVTTGKPMLNKLGKTISSKLGGKQPAGGPPQHLQSYANYQQHQNQGQNQAQGQPTQPQSYQQQQPNQTYSPQPQHQQWQPPQQPQQHQQTPPPPVPGAYAPQPSPYQQSNYATPISAHPGQGNYFPAQQPPGPPPGAPTYNSAVMGTEGGTTAPEQQMHAQQGYGDHQGQPQGQFQPQQPQTGQFQAQQTGVVGVSPGPANAHHGDVSPILPPSQPVIPPQWQSPPEQSYAGSQPQMPSPGTSHQQPFGVSTLQQSGHPGPDQQQWNASPNQAQFPPPAAPVSPPPLQMHSKPPVAPSMPPQPSQSPGPPPQHSVPEHSQTEFIAELPADMGNMSLGETKTGTQYQAYQPQVPQAGSPTNRFSVPRRAMSGSSLPLADPWRFADPITEQPTREFYILADLLFEALDRKFEPQNTGMLEAPKVLRSWIELTQDAYRLFSYNNYNALASMWSIEGIPHMMVPVQPTLTPVWNFNQHSHAQDLKINAMPNMDYVTYLPALNRTGWYKFFFLEMLAGSDDLGKLLASVCADTYKPGVLNQPDLNKRDKSDIPALHARAAEIQGVAIRRACEEAGEAMSSPSVPPLASAHQAAHIPASSNSTQQASPGDMAMLMHEIQMASNDIAVASVAEGQVYRPAPNQSGGYSRHV